MNIFTPVSMFLTSDVTQRHVLLVPYEIMCQLLYQHRNIGYNLSDSRCSFCSYFRLSQTGFHKTTDLCQGHVVASWFRHCAEGSRGLRLQSFETIGK